MKRVPLVLASLASGLCLTGFCATLFWPGAELAVRELLEWLGPLTFSVTLGLVAVGIFICRREYVTVLRRLRLREWLWVSVFMGAALVTRWMAVPITERVYYDEHTYLQIARGIAGEGRARAAAYGLIHHGDYHCELGSYPHWPSGWPTLVAGMIRLSGYDRRIGGWINQALALITIPLVALLAAELLASGSAGVAAAAVFAGVPANHLWARTSAAEVFAVFAATVAVMQAVLLARNPNARLAILAAITAAMAAQIRNESLLILPECAAVVLVLGGVVRWRFWLAPAALTCLLLLPQALHLGTIVCAYDPVSVEGSGFGLQYVLPNLQAAAGYLGRERWALACLVLAVIGMVCRFAAPAVLPLSLWAGSALLLPMAHFGGSFAFPGGERFLLAGLPALAIAAASTLRAMCSAGGRRIPWLPAALGMVMFLGASASTGNHAMTEDAKTRIPREDCAFLRRALAMMPEDCLLVTADPATVLAEGRSAFFLPLAADRILELRQAAAVAKRDLFLHISPSSLPQHWPNGKVGMEQIAACFTAEPLVEQRGPDGLRAFYQLVERESGPVSIRFPTRTPNISTPSP